MPQTNESNTGDNSTKIVIHYDRAACQEMVDVRIDQAEKGHGKELTALTGITSKRQDASSAMNWT
jgi:hypothetical protein